MITTYFKWAQRVALWALLTSLGGTVMAQTLLRFDHQKQINQQIMETLYAKTIVCMRTATQAMLRQGSRDAEQVMTFNLKTCAYGLHQHLTTTMGWEETDSIALLVRISTMTINKATL